MPKTSANGFVFALIFLHLAIALPLAFFLSIWNDEASSLYATQQGFWVSFQTATSEQKQAPLYFWILSLWRSLNDTIFFARLFSIICSIAAIWLFSRLSDRLVKPRAAFLATAFFALHPVLVWASLEIRVYSLVTLLSIGLIHLFLDAFWLDVKKGWVPKMQFVVLAIVALYTNYYLGFLLAGFVVPLLVFRRWRSTLSYVTLMTVAGLAFLPMILSVRSEFLDRSSSFVEEKSLIEGLRILWHHVLSYLLPTDILPVGETSAVSLVRLWIVRLGLVTAVGLIIARWRQVSTQTLGLAAIVATIFAFLLLAYFLVGSWLIALRHASVLFAPFILFSATLINDLFPERGKTVSITARLGLTALTIIVIASFTYALVNLYPGFTKKGDWERVGKYIEHNERPDQPIIIFHTYDALALPYYYNGVNRVYPDERFFEFDFGTPSAERTKKRTAFTISKIPPDAAEIWLIVNDECQTPGICEPFDEFIRNNYSRVSEMAFRDQTVTLLRKKPSTAGSYQ